jgi:hypothetical protein
MVYLRGKNEGQVVGTNAVAVKNKDGSLSILVASSTPEILQPEADGRISMSLNGQRISLEIIASPWKFEVIDNLKSSKTTEFSLVSDNGKILKMGLVGRSAFERKIKQEAEIIREASPEDEVPVEWYYHPFYRPLGHTSVRIGDALYEFTLKGWEIHGANADNPRAFLFNNPFFKSQYEKYKDEGMSPVSLGVTLRLKKNDVDKFIQSVSESAGQKFSLWFSNCNQCIIRGFSETPLEILNSSSYTEFSSILTFRHLLLDSPIKRDDLVAVYPISGLDISAFNLRDIISTRLYRFNSSVLEIYTNLKSIMMPTKQDAAPDHGNEDEAIPK